MAAPGGRTRPLRTRRRARRPAVPRGDAPDVVARWDAARTGLGRRTPPGARPASRPAKRVRDAPGLGPRRVREARPLDRPRARHRPSRGGLAALSRRGARTAAGDLALRCGTPDHPGRAQRCGSSCSPRLGSATRSMAGRPGPTSTRGRRASGCGSPTCPPRPHCRAAEASTSRSGGRRPAVGKDKTCACRSDNT